MPAGEPIRSGSSPAAPPLPGRRSSGSEVLAAAGILGKLHHHVRRADVQVGQGEIDSDVGRDRGMHFLNCHLGQVILFGGRQREDRQAHEPGLRQSNRERIESVHGATAIHIPQKGLGRR